MLKAGEEFERISATIPKSILKEFKMLSQKQRRSVSAQLTLVMEEAIKAAEKLDS